MKIRYPSPLQKGDKIAITAPSSGLTPAQYPRLDLVLKNLRDQGFEVVEGKCLRKKHKHVSGPKEERAAELVRFWNDPSVKTIMPPWGGEILVEILPLLDFEELGNSTPKWISGYSDVSTLLFSLTLLTGIATVHGSNLMDLVPKQTDALTNSLIGTLQLTAGSEFVQSSVPLYQSKWADFETHVDAPLNLTDKTTWKKLKEKFVKNQFSGRMIGGCLDTVARLVGTNYAPVPKFIHDFKADGTILYLENCEMPPCELVRTLWNLKLAGWFDGLSGLLLGRSAGPDAKQEAELSYEEALHSVLSDLEFPVVYDVDIGHRPPQFSIVNGSLGTIELDGDGGTLRQRLV